MKRGNKERSGVNPGLETEIKTADNKIVKGIAPVIVSASRSTDIPAFFAKWFFNRLEQGYVKWINPFNWNKSQYISFENARVVVFWTKNAKPIIPYLDKLDEKGINYYFQHTINDYEAEELEPNVPPISVRIATIKALAEKIGKERVIWRFDPLILSEKLTVPELLKKVRVLGNKLLPYTNKLVFSYADIAIYKKVQNNLVRDIPGLYNRNNVLAAEFTTEQKIEFAEGIQKVLAEWKKVNPDFSIATCAEDIDLRKYDIAHNKCIDDELMIKLFKTDKTLMHFISFDENQKLLFDTRPNLKDKGQRKDCGCIISKDIGSYNTCNHLCTYCYANTSRKIVTSNQNRMQENSESILGCTSNELN